MITIVDYGMGNLGSIRNMLKKVGADCEITSDPSRIAGATKLILPGVGAFDAGMSCLNASGFVPVLNEQVLQRKVPVLGICLGMHLMTQSSEEGTMPGLGWIDARTARFSFPEGSQLKVPHMGWNVVTHCKPSVLTLDVQSEERFYFVHSYYVTCKSPDDVLMRAEYGHQFDAAFQHENLMGVQFHPEKSHKFGMRLLSKFAAAQYA